MQFEKNSMKLTRICWIYCSYLGVHKCKDSKLEKRIAQTIILLQIKLYPFLYLMCKQAKLPVLNYVFSKTIIWPPPNISP